MSDTYGELTRRYADLKASPKAPQSKAQDDKRALQELFDSLVTLKQLLPQVVALSERAGEAILEIYQAPESFDTVYKDDRSPLTRADLASHHLIVAGLSALSPQLPVLSEESRALPFEERQRWPLFWMVDPLDGTKEFLRRNGEFTVNIALIFNDEPVLGVVAVPAQRSVYSAAKGVGAFYQRERSSPVPVQVADYQGGALKVVASRSHAGPETEAFLERLRARFGELESLSVGSALKLCLVADGSAHLYPRLGPTMEWDTAAAQCVVEQAGGVVTNLEGERLLYNKAVLKNDFFVVSCSGFSWRAAD